MIVISITFPHSSPIFPVSFHTISSSASLISIHANNFPLIPCRLIIIITYIHTLFHTLWDKGPGCCSQQLRFCCAPSPLPPTTGLRSLCDKVTALSLSFCPAPSLGQSLFYSSLYLGMLWVAVSFQRQRELHAAEIQSLTTILLQREGGATASSWVVSVEGGGHERRSFQVVSTG